MDIESLAKELILKNMNPEQQLAVLDGIKASVAQAKEVQKQRIGENVGLVVDALKKIESDIRSRYDEVGNTIQKRVATIKDGKDGKDGRDGRNGKDGRDGKQGVQGVKGEDGRDGRDGVDGIDGVSVTSARIDFDGSLVISLSSGIELNVGEVVAPDLAESIKVITNGGGTSQFVLDTLASLQTQITNLIPSQTGNSGKYLTTNGTALSWASVAGGLSYQGTWNATTNTPTLASSTGTNGYYYIVATAGSTNLDGITDWQIGDWLMFNGSVWQKIDQSNLVTSVNGQTGAVSVGTVTSVSALTLGTTGTDLSSTVATSTTTPVITLNVPTASATNRGALSSADWTTFNNKGSGTVTSVSGTTGRITSTGGTTPVLDLTSGVATAGTTGSASLIPVITIDTYGRVTSITTAANPQGTVTSVTGTSPVASSGGATPAISLSAGYGDTLNPYASKTANYVLAAPNGSAGVPTFRAVVAADIPTLNQNTTGTASNVTGTVAIANGGTGLTSFTANQIHYGSFSQSANLSFDGTTLTANNITSASATALTLKSAGTTAITVDTSQNVGVGTTSPSSKFSVGTASYGQQPCVAQVNGTSLAIANNAGIFNIGCTDAAAADVGGSLGFTANGGVNGYSAGQISGRRESATSSVYSSYMAFSTTSSNSAITEKMRITSAGAVGIGVTSPSQNLDVAGSARLTYNGGANYIEFQSANNYVGRNGSTGDLDVGVSGNQNINFIISTSTKARLNVNGEFLTGGTTDNGAYNLQCNGTAVWGAGAYVNGSDSRIKNDIAPLNSGLDVVAKLNPVTYKYKETWSKDQSTQTGFIAQELLKALEGKNYVNGIVQQSGEYLSVAYQNIIPILTKAIQELSAKNDALTARIVALESK